MKRGLTFIIFILLALSVCAQDIKTTDMAGYRPELVTRLPERFGTSAQIGFKLETDPIHLTPPQAIPLGLIINEAITNSIKYAFPGNRKGEISISMIEKSYKINLELADNGIGMPEIDSNVEAGSLGLQLIKGLSEDIEADIRFEVDNGTKITITFEPEVLNYSENFLRPVESKDAYV